RGEGAGVPEADERREHLVRGTEPAQPGEGLGLADGTGSDGRRRVTNRIGNGRIDEGVERRVPERVEHRVLLRGSGTDVAADEPRRLPEIAEAVARAVTHSAPA